MKIDRRGDIGFMEAMAGAMTVCIVLMAFTTFLAHETYTQQEETKSFDWTCVRGITFSDGEYEICFSSEPSEYPDQQRCSGLEFKLISSLEPDSILKQETFGITGGPCTLERKLYSVQTGEGGNNAVILEVRTYT